MKSEKLSRGFEYLRIFLKQSPLSHALWRSVEALSFERQSLQGPVLDLGCGYGEFSGVVFGKIECGVDVSISDLEKAMAGKKYKKLMLADARELPFKNKSFSTVISVSVMEHIKRPELVLSEVGRILRKNGKFIFSVPTTYFYENLLGVKILKLLRMKWLAEKYLEVHKKVFAHVSIFPPSWWEKQLLKNGFTILTKEGTISSRLASLHEVFLITALPSQIGRWLGGSRWVWGKWRENWLPKLFKHFVMTDTNSNLNMFYVARKNG